MHRRITSWQGLGITYILCHRRSFFEAEITSRPKLIEPRILPGDNTLSTFLHDHHGYLEHISKFLKSSSVIKASTSDGGPPFHRLLSAVREIKGGTKRALYSNETALDFHDLLIAAFVQFGLALRKVRVAWYAVNNRKVILGQTASSTKVGMHCEAVLASLLANGSEGVGVAHGNTSAVDDIFPGNSFFILVKHSVDHTQRRWIMGSNFLTHNRSSLHQSLHRK